MASGLPGMPPPLHGSPMPSSHSDWHGEDTLHIYCYDYLLRKGMHECAHIFARDTGIIEEDWKGAPIDAPQGLLYEWWAVFWDVFIARTHQGTHNKTASEYVNGIRKKREGVIINMEDPIPHKIQMVRGMVHGGPRQPRPVDHRYLATFAPAARPGLGPGGGLGHPGLPPGAIGRPPQQGMPPHFQPQQQPPQGQFGAGPSGSTPTNHAPMPPGSHSVQPPSSHAPPQGGPSPYAQHPSYPAHPQSGSLHSSPHLANLAPAPQNYVNGRPTPTPQNRPPPPQDGLMMPTLAEFQQAMAAVGLGGRDPDSLAPEEQSAVQQHLRKTSNNGAGGPGGGPQQIMRGPPPPSGPPQGPQGGLPGPRVVPQRMHPDAQRPPQQYSGMSPQQIAQIQHQQAQQQRMIDHNQQQQHQMLPPQQQQQHREQLQRQAEAQHRQLQAAAAAQQAAQMSATRQNGIPPPPMFAPQQSSQQGQPPLTATSPASPMYSAAASPYAAGSLPGHIVATPNANSPPQFSPSLAAPTRAGTKSRVASAKPSPATSKRSSNEDTSPRSRKRARGQTDEGPDSSQIGSTPRHDQSEPPSPATGLRLTIPAGLPSSQARSPQDAAFSALQLANQANAARGFAPSQQQVMGDQASINGFAPVSGPPGSISLPTSANGGSRPGSASAYGNQHPSGSDHKPSPPILTNGHGLPTSSTGDVEPPSPAYHANMPTSMLSLPNFQINGAATGDLDLKLPGPDATPGLGGAPFSSGDIPGFDYTDMINMDVSNLGLDLAFNEYLNPSMFDT